MSFLIFLSNFRNDYLDIFFRAISYLGEITVLLPLLCIVYWCINKQFAFKALLSYFISGSLVQGAKIVFRIPRPWVLNTDFTPVGSGIETATGYSFPSGHTQSASSVYLSFSNSIKKKWFSILSYTTVLLIMLSRMYLGVHTPKDVIVSFAVSIIVIKLIDYVLANISFPRTNKLALLIIVVTYCVGVCAYSYLLIKWNLSTLELVSDSIAFCGGLIAFSFGTYIENRYIKFDTRCFSFIMQIVKIIIGIGGILGIKILFSTYIGNELISNTLVSFLSCLWATCIFPIFIKLIQKKKYSDL